MDKETEEPAMEIQDNNKRMSYIQCLEPLLEEIEPPPSAVCDKKQGDLGKEDFPPDRVEIGDKAGHLI